MPGDSKKYRDQDDLDQVQIKEDYQNGPVMKRKCTDWWCCPVFVAFVVGMIVIAIYGFTNGDPAALATPFDSEGNQCGLTKGYSDFPYIFFANPVNFGSNESDDSSTLAFNLVCVRSCPWYSDREGTWKDILNAPENPSASEETAFSDGFSDSSSDLTELGDSEASSSSSSSSDWVSIFSDTLTSSDGESGYADYIDSLFSWLSLFNSAYSPYKWTDFFKFSELDCKPNSVVDSCSINFVDLFIFDSWPFLSRYCLPNLDSEFMTEYYSEFIELLGVSDTMEEWISDCYLTLWIIIASAAFALVIGLIYMVLLQLLAPIITYLMILSIFLILVAAGALCYVESQDLEDQMTSDSTWDSQKTMYALAIIFWVAAGIFFLLIVCMYHKIRVALGVIKTAAQFIRKEFLILFFPLFVAAALVGFYIFWVWAAVYIYSLGEPEADSGSILPTMVRTDNEKYMFYYHLFALLWINAFILAWGTFVIASAACIWYFTHGHEHSGIHPIRTSIWRGSFYHLGSLAFGSFILAVIQAVRLALAYLNVSFFFWGLASFCLF